VVFENLGVKNNANLWIAWLLAVILIVWLAPSDFGGELRHDVVKEARRIDAALARGVATAAWPVREFLGWTRGVTHPLAVQGPDTAGGQATTPLPRKTPAKASASNVEEAIVPPKLPEEEADSLARNSASDVDTLDYVAVLVPPISAPQISNTAERPDGSPPQDTLAIEPATDESSASESVVE